MFNTKHLLALAATALPLMAHANIPVPNFDFYENGDAKEYSLPLIDQTTSAPSYTSGTDRTLAVTVTTLKSNGSSALVAERWDGLGIDSGGLLSSTDATTGESYRLTFNKAVTLTGLQFSGWDNPVRDPIFGILLSPGDDATLSLGSTTVDLGALGNDNHPSAKTFTLSRALSGTSFTIRADAGEFRLAGIFATAQAPAVPEPGTYALMGLGLVGLACVARRRQR